MNIQQEEPQKKTLYRTITEEASTNLAFRFTLIGAILAISGVLITSVITLLAYRMTFMAIAVILNYFLVVGIMILALYTNYCVVYGKCKTLAMWQGVLTFIMSIAIVLISLTNLTQFVSARYSPSSSSLTSSSPTTMSYSSSNNKARQQGRNLGVYRNITR
jgi:uncharacterized membrane protein